MLKNIRHQNAEVGLSGAKVGLTKKKSDTRLSKQNPITNNRRLQEQKTSDFHFPKEKVRFWKWYIRLGKRKGHSQQKVGLSKLKVGLFQTKSCTFFNTKSDFLKRKSDLAFFAGKVGLSKLKIRLCWDKLYWKGKVEH